MTVQLSSSGTIALEGICPSDDAEILLQYLLGTPAAVVDLRACEGAHTAVLQVLLVAKPQLLGPPAGRVLKDWLQPLLTRATA